VQTGAAGSFRGSGSNKGTERRLPILSGEVRSI
jgi:hypothetical protein